MLLDYKSSNRRNSDGMAIEVMIWKKPLAGLEQGENCELD